MPLHPPSRPAVAAREPTLERLPWSWQRYLLATRPAFLLASVVPVLLGLAVLMQQGDDIAWPLGLLTLLGVLLIHAAINVLNDYYDAVNGSDAGNSARLYPYTGGSRFIQNGLFTRAHTRRYGLWLLAMGAMLGVALAYHAGAALWALGLFGIFLGWAYSAPPLRLNSRGWGELSVGLGFGVCIPLGAVYVHSGQLSDLALRAGLAYGLLVTNLLYINQFPDREADARAGKHHWVVRLPLARARWIYGVLAALAYLWVLLQVAQRQFPTWALLSLLPAAASGRAAWLLWRHAATPARLVPAIRLTIVAMLSHGVLLALALVLS